jgi:hypothetical protein
MAGAERARAEAAWMASGVLRPVLARSGSARSITWGSDFYNVQITSGMKRENTSGIAIHHGTPPRRRSET